MQHDLPNQETPIIKVYNESLYTLGSTTSPQVGSIKRIKIDPS